MQLKTSKMIGSTCRHNHASGLHLTLTKCQGIAKSTKGVGLTQPNKTDGFCGTKAWRRRRRRRRLLVEGERGVDEGFKVDVFESHGRIDSPTTKSWGKVFRCLLWGPTPHNTREGPTISAPPPISFFSSSLQELDPAPPPSSSSFLPPLGFSSCSLSCPRLLQHEVIELGSAVVTRRWVVVAVAVVVVVVVEEEEEEEISHGEGGGEQ
ncbi:hypothetical protein BHE74_00021046 [Ensete ventricosum]|nr:hypothetical protein BHE74_00021046 [Ensete ventricosum]